MDLGASSTVSVSMELCVIPAMDTASVLLDTGGHAARKVVYTRFRAET